VESTFRTETTIPGLSSLIMSNTIATSVQRSKRHSSAVIPCCFGAFRSRTRNRRKPFRSEDSQLIRSNSAKMPLASGSLQLRGKEDVISPHNIAILLSQLLGLNIIIRILRNIRHLRQFTQLVTKWTWETSERMEEYPISEN
jgi:hypothetical protein